MTTTACAPSGNKEKIEAHLALAREQVRFMDAQAAEEEKMALLCVHLAGKPGKTGDRRDVF